MKSSFSKHWKLNMYLCVNKKLVTYAVIILSIQWKKAVTSTLHLDVCFYEKFNEIKQRSKILSNSPLLNPVESNELWFITTSDGPMT